MSKTLAPSQAVTTRDSKGLKFVSIVEAAYNKAGLSDEEAQRVNDAPGLPDVVRDFIETNRVEHEWREQDGVIYFSVTSDGTTGPEWIERLAVKGFRVSGYAKSVLYSPDFRPTKGITSLIAVLKGKIFSDDECVTKNIRAEAERRGHAKPNAEVACLIREQFSDEDIEAMGLFWIVTMHEPINDSDGAPRLLNAFLQDGGRWLHSFRDRPDFEWVPVCGFAFVVP